MRIISVVPSLTEILFDFGLDHQHIVGRTKFCIHPKDKIQFVPIIGGTKNLDIEKIIHLKPDLILANKEENQKDQILHLQKHCKVITTNIGNLEDNYYLLKTIGELLDKRSIAQQFNLKIQEQFNFQKPNQTLKVAYLIWKSPYMTVGGDTFINDVLKELNLENIFKDQKRYPMVELQDLEKADVILLSSEPFPFKEKHILEIQDVFPNKKILLVDGEAFSWYGTRIAKIGNYYQNLLQSILL